MAYAIITGGSSGLGLELAKLLANKKYDVIIVGKTEKKVVAAVRGICDEHGLVCISTMGIGRSFYVMGNGEISVAGIVADVSEEGEAERIFDFAAHGGKEISLLVNCAGSEARRVASELDSEFLLRAFRDNAAGQALMCAQALKYMKKGLIIDVMSSAALKGNAGETAYCGAKWAARGFHEAFKAEIAEIRPEIKTLAVYPSGMRTPFWENCETPPDTTGFMSPRDVAEKIVAALSKEGDTCCVSELIVEKSKF